jgi:iron complex transport system substrate-binding protein
MRIVSLLPSATEIVCALGAGGSLVGVSHECDYPPAVRNLPAVTRPKIRTDTTSAVIDQSVRELVARGLSVYEIDVERLRALAPDLIVTQEQCEVCAVSYREVEAATRRTLGAGVEIVSLAPCALSDVWQDIGRAAAAVGRSDEGATLVAACQQRLAALAADTASFTRPIVACIEWLDPLMVAGNWIPELVELAGGVYPFVAPGAMSRSIAWHALLEARPDVVVLMPCGFTIAQTRREVAALTARPEWAALPAVQRGRASIVDGNAYLNRPGPRLVESAEILAALIHPETGAGRIPAGAVEPLSVR